MLISDTISFFKLPLPDALLDQTIEALEQGKNEKADRLFQQIEEDGEKLKWFNTTGHF